MNIINAPLAERMRPQTLADYVGQSHLLAEGSFLQKAFKIGQIPSIILWGPPGVGKTTLALLIAKQIKAEFYTLSAISSGVKEVREVIEKAKFHPRTLLFIDEIHRFSKSQQDALLGAVEKGILTLIGATTENPSFEVISALLSRCQVYTLKTLNVDEQLSLLDKAIKEDIILKSKSITLKETEALLKFADGDARKLLNLFELVCLQSEDVVVTNAMVLEVAQQKVFLYDKNGENHYDVISAFIKSIRGSDPNAALYWMARMIEGGEDLKFIARRLLVLSSEDIGNANPNALFLANNCYQAVAVIGAPEAEIILSQCVIYLATSPKSNASYLAIKNAKILAKEAGNLPVPMHLRNAPTGLMKKEGYGKGYKYAHEYYGNFIDQEFYPEELSGTVLYQPGDNNREKEMREKLIVNWKGKYKY